MNGRYLRGQPRYNRLDLIQVAWILPQDAKSERSYFGLVLRTFQLLLELAKLRENDLNPGMRKLRTEFFERAKNLFDKENLSEMYLSSWHRQNWPHNAGLLNRMEDVRWKQNSNWMKEAAELVGYGLRVSKGIINARNLHRQNNEDLDHLKSTWYEKLSSFKSQFHDSIEEWVKSDLEKSLIVLDEMLEHASVLERTTLIMGCIYDTPLEDLVSWLLTHGEEFPQLSRENKIEEMSRFLGRYGAEMTELERKELLKYFQLHEEIAALTDGSHIS